jgi:hypothetical protein
MSPGVVNSEGHNADDGRILTTRPVPPTKLAEGIVVIAIFDIV